MFDDESEIICWFDTEIQSKAVGVPERELDEFMFALGGPFAITERSYASAGQVKAVIIKGFGFDSVETNSGDPVDGLRKFAGRFGLTLIARPRSGRSLESHGGRYYSHCHEPQPKS